MPALSSVFPRLDQRCPRRDAVRRRARGARGGRVHPTTALQDHRQMVGAGWQSAEFPLRSTRDLTDRDLAPKPGGRIDAENGGRPGTRTRDGSPERWHVLRRRRSDRVQLTTTELHRSSADRSEATAPRSGACATSRFKTPSGRDRCPWRHLHRASSRAAARAQRCSAAAAERRAGVRRLMFVSAGVTKEEGLRVLETRPSPRNVAAFVHDSTRRARQDARGGFFSAHTGTSWLRARPQLPGAGGAISRASAIP
jgi:hypothetical protein